MIFAPHRTSRWGSGGCARYCRYVADDLCSPSDEPMGERRVCAGGPPVLVTGGKQIVGYVRPRPHSAAEPDGLPPTRAWPRPPQPWAPQRTSRWGSGGCARSCRHVADDLGSPADEPMIESADQNALATPGTGVAYSPSGPGCTGGSASHVSAFGPSSSCEFTASSHLTS